MTAMSGPGLVVTTPSDREIVMTREFDAPRRLVFDAWTKAEHIKNWFGRRGDIMTVCEVDLRVGGAWRYVWRLREGGEMGMHGEYREIAPPERLVSTEEFEGADAETMAPAVNTLTLEERHGTTTMRTGSLYGSREARDAVIATGMETGAAESFDRLAELLATLS